MVDRSWEKIVFSYSDSYAGGRARAGEVHPTSLTSELEGDKMVLKIAKPPRDKDSIAGLAWQCCTWMVSSPVASALAGGQHALEAEHLASRSYLPSAAGQAAYYQVLSLKFKPSTCAFET